jgi:hypothetical protein
LTDYPHHIFRGGKKYVAKGRGNAGKRACNRAVSKLCEQFFVF